MNRLGLQGPLALKKAMSRVKKKKLTKAQSLIRQIETEFNRGEETLRLQLKSYETHGGRVMPYPKLQFKFHPERNHRFDFAWPRSISSCANQSFVGPAGFAIELDGMCHGINEKRLRDLEKGNLAIANGWNVFHFTPKQAEDGLVIDFLLAVFDKDVSNDPETILQRKAVK